MLQFTEKAVEKVHYFLKNADQKDMVLRINFVDTDQDQRTYAFHLEPQENVTSKDLTMPAHGFYVRMDSKTAIKLSAQVVDWEAKDGKAGFTIKNSSEAYQPSQHLDQSLKDQVIGMLKTIYDPEIPVNIYDLGLIYEVNMKDENKVHIVMTLTAPSCPAAEALPEEVKEKVLLVPTITEVDLALTWEPAWSPDRMSELAKAELGM
ncbi:MAG: DUF59 domain-containing protein [Bdellovibrionales bacterium]|nr:DUF59 domain-containing protein [Bdellovibrionales bacterium]